MTGNYFPSMSLAYLYFILNIGESKACTEIKAQELQLLPSPDYLNMNVFLITCKFYKKYVKCIYTCVYIYICSRFSSILATSAPN